MGRGLFRVWAVLSLAWLGYVYVSRAAWSFPIEKVALWPPGLLGLLFLAMVWMGGGFRRDA